MPLAVIITGPTASGKTALSVDLALHFGTEIVSADSRQVYRELAIGTATPTEQERRGVPHHLLGNITVTEPYDAARFEKDALKALEGIWEKNDLAIVCGGTGFYIRTLCHGIDNIPDVPAEIRSRIRQMYHDQGLQHVQEYLYDRDPVAYNSIDIQNPHRLIRALEVFESTGLSITAFKKGMNAKRPFSVIKIGLALPVEELRQRINERVDEMMKKGLLEEAKHLVQYRHLQALQTVGYTELFDHLDGKISLLEAVELIKLRTRQYAKRQMTWLRREEGIKWFHPSDMKGIVAYITAEKE